MAALFNAQRNDVTSTLCMGGVAEKQCAAVMVRWNWN